MRVVIGTFGEETNSFSPMKCDIGAFKKGSLAYGEDIISIYRGTSTTTGAFIDVLEKEKAVIIPSVFAWGGALGPVTEDAYREIESALLKTIRTNWPIDGVLLYLHGATIVADDYDGTGRLLERVRQAVGDRVAVAGTLDLHSNVTDRMIVSADILVGDHTFPHVDDYEVGYTAASLLVKTLKGEIKPIMAMCKMPMMHQAEACRTDEYPFKRLIDKVMEMESKEEVLSASVQQMQPWLDVEDAGASVIVIADGNEEMAAAYAKSLAKTYWDMREELAFELTPLEKAVDRAVKIDGCPVVIADSADSPSGGAPGDSTFVLSYLLSNNIDVDTIITMVDPEAVEKAIGVGVGQEAEFSLGGKIGIYSKPVSVRGIVKLISDGEYVQERRNDRGIKASFGRSVVIKTGKISIVVMEKSWRAWEPSLYRSVGLEPKNTKLVIVKSPLNFREAYEGMAKEIYVVDTPGVTCSNFRSLPYKNIRRPMYPFDDIKTCEIKVRALGHRLE